MRAEIMRLTVNFNFLAISVWPKCNCSVTTAQASIVVAHPKGWVDSLFEISPVVLLAVLEFAIDGGIEANRFYMGLAKQRH